MSPTESSIPREPAEPSLYLVISQIWDWEAGELPSPVPSHMVLTDEQRAKETFDRHVVAIREAVDAETAKVEAGVEEGLYIPTAGCNVILRLYRVPLSHRTPTNPPEWDLQEEDDYLLCDESYSVEYGDGYEFTGEEDSMPEVDDINLEDYLPPAHTVTQTRAGSNE